MKSYKRITALTIVVLSAFFCIAQFSAKKNTAICSKCRQEAAATGSDADDFSFVSLITLKCM